ncbi:CIA30 family protein [bacterium]|jgi:NADH dehydrogenase [ubiquinone] 1 alpha subcomplex assembly factor 1|nr:CIA30 family protein [bacterium]MDA9775941.1 CIA30 family protein [Flavobacteriales bacterium]MDB4052279.1 CIA30 family protein [Flavobacteriales bacterium]MDB4195872.1 CIA30 family protein [Flavobacteriales bacterium]MDB9702424.1 CIA30 family protein [Flavobacteriales bacterium]|tara:strand:- start:1008 stop:1538 length:531 start_codon:yes stop_codon:yes gene_type:complete
MKLISTILLISAMASSSVIFDFKSNSNLNKWKVVDDTVMGGRSQGNLILNEEKNGVFFGTVSTENYGGFSSIRYNGEAVSTKDKTHVLLRVKGDGKSYQFRIKNENSLRYSFITEFKTSGKWETIRLSLADFYPSFRGRKLDKPNFNHSEIEEIAFLIGNKKNESFKLIIESITLD